MFADEFVFCPRCGSRLETVREAGSCRSGCPSCGFVAYHNPLPVVVATVVDGDAALFVRRGRAPDKGCWTLPGGFMEMDEPPEVGAARELAEETGLAVDPGDLSFTGTIYEPQGGDRAVVDLVFAVPLERTWGEPVAGDDAAAVRFWSRDEIAENPWDLRAGDVTPILWAIDTLGAAPDAGEPTAPADARRR